MNPAKRWWGGGPHREVLKMLRPKGNHEKDHTMRVDSCKRLEDKYIGPQTGWKSFVHCGLILHVWCHGYVLHLGHNISKFCWRSDLFSQNKVDWMTCCLGRSSVDMHGRMYHNSGASFKRQILRAERCLMSTPKTLIFSANIILHAH